MTQDLLAPYRTQPSQPAVNPSSAVTQPTPGVPDRHRSVADGELKTAWTLKEFFVSLNSVMRLPTRARRREQPRTEPAAAAELPGLHPGITRFFMVAGGVAVVVLLVVKPLVGWMTDSGSASLTHVSGVWQAGKGKHQGRKFEVTDSAVVFHTGDGATDYTWHKIQQVKMKQVGDSSLYTVKYEEGKGTVDLTFWFYQRPAPAIRLKNQPGVLWSLTRDRPVTGPPPSNRPRL